MMSQSSVSAQNSRPHQNLNLLNHSLQQSNLKWRISLRLMLLAGSTLPRKEKDV